MESVADVVEALKSKGSEKTQATYVRHGMPADKVLGVSVADLKPIAKQIKGKQTLIQDVFETGIMDAMYLAGMVADGSLLNPEKLGAWAELARGMNMIAEYSVPWVVLDHPQRLEIASSWMDSGDDHRATIGWTILTGMVATEPDSALDLDLLRSRMAQAIREISSSSDRLKLAMNSYVIAVGCYIPVLNGEAKQAAREIGKVTADMGKTACKVPDAIAAIEKVESAGRLGRKRATMRC